MNKLQIFSTGSGGNAALLTTDTGRVLLDAGVANILPCIEYDPTNVIAIITHIHGDHCNDKAIKTLDEYGVPIYSASAEVHHKYPCVKIMQQATKFEKENMEVIAVPVFHDVMNFAYFMRLPDGKVLAWMTDLHGLSPSFTFCFYVDLALVECNYDYSSLEADRTRPKFVNERVSHNHMDVIRCADAIRQMEPARTLLIHPSSTCLDRAYALGYINAHGGPAEFAEVKKIYEF